MSTVQTRTERASSAPPLDTDTEMQVVEALIFVSDEPITLEQIKQVVPGRSSEEIRALVEELSSSFSGAGRGLRIEEVAGGFRFSTRPELAPWIRTYFRNRNRARLSPASIETLAVIAYKQPITAPEIHEIRGVDPQGSMKTLLEKRLIKIAGKKKVVGRPFLYKTTREFLLHFGLAGIEDLPPIEDFERLAGEISSQAEAVTSDDMEGLVTVTPSGNGHDNGAIDSSHSPDENGESSVDLDASGSFVKPKPSGSSRVTPSRASDDEGEGDEEEDDEDDAGDDDDFADEDDDSDDAEDQDEE